MSADIAVAPPPAQPSFSSILNLHLVKFPKHHSINSLKHLYSLLLRLNLLHHHHHHLPLLLRSCFLSSHPNVAIVFFSNYSKTHDQSERHSLFLHNTMLRGLVAFDRSHEVINLFSSMHATNLSPNHFTFPFVLKAASHVQNLPLGLCLHSHLTKSGFDKNVFVSTSLVSLYAKCGKLDDAQNLFDEMPQRNVVSWTALITGYMEVGELEKVVGLFREALEVNGLQPDSFTLVRVLSACSQLGDLKTGEWVHGYVEEKGVGLNVFVATALIDMYSKCGSMERAQRVFDGMGEKDVVSWSAIIGGYSSNGMPEEALQLFFQMRDAGLRPDCYTMVGALSSCAKSGALELGHEVSMLMDLNDILSNPVLGTTLIDMYAKCGSISRAWNVFKAMKKRDLIVWNAMISGFGMTGHGKLSFALFLQMEKLGVKPDGNTFMGILCSCTHTGLVEDGRRYFDSMNRLYNITPRIEHYGCLVDLLGRAGLLEDAYQLIKKMPMEANAVVWGALLGGCRLHRDTNLAERVLKQLIRIEPYNSGNYVLLSNILSMNGRWNDAEKLREIMIARGIQKIPGCSWVELNGLVHEFRVGDNSHPLTEKIYEKLYELGTQLKVLGYVPTTDVVMFDVEEEEKEHTLGYHSEKLAVAFGLISMSPNDTIRVVKNLRVCNDCHTAIKLISKITNREIIVRDNNRFHSFREGYCSCNDYW